MTDYTVEDGKGGVVHVNVSPLLPCQISMLNACTLLAGQFVSNTELFVARPSVWSNTFLQDFRREHRRFWADSSVSRLARTIPYITGTRARILASRFELHSVGVSLKAHVEGFRSIRKIGSSFSLSPSDRSGQRRSSHKLL